MNNGRLVAPGRTRSCPHCKATILESATVCPGCHHHLRFDPAALQRVQPTATALRVEGKIRHPPDGEPCEYAVVIAVRNARGEELARHVVGVGALQPADERSFTLSVDLFRPVEVKEVKPPPKDTAQLRDGRQPLKSTVVSTAGPARDPKAPQPGVTAQSGVTVRPQTLPQHPGSHPAQHKPSAAPVGPQPAKASGSTQLPLTPPAAPGPASGARPQAPLADPKLKPKDS